jgi:hypothetical protein
MTEPITKQKSGLPLPRPQLVKAPTGIQGLDEITGGGLPQGRPTLLCGSAGCGKTLLASGDQILAIPTLVRKLPEPVRKIIGDLSNTERVLIGLDLKRRD